MLTRRPSLHPSQAQHELRRAARLLVVIMLTTHALLADDKVSAASDHFQGVPADVFVANEGQYPEAIRFVGRSSDAMLLVTDTGLILQARERLPEPDSDSLSGRREIATPSIELMDGVNVHLGWRAATAQVTGSTARSGLVNYFRGQNPDAWVLNAPTFSSLRVDNAWKGVDLSLRLEAGALVLDVQADDVSALERVSWDFDGGHALREVGGNLIADTNLGTMRLGRLTVQAAGLEAKTVMGPQRTLVHTVTPTVSSGLGGPYPQYSTFLGGAGDESLRGIANDPAGSAFKVIVSGFTTSSVIYPAPPGPYQTPQGAEDVFVAKLPQQSGVMPDFVWASYIGGRSLERGQRLKVTDNGDVYVTGYTFSVDYPTTVGSLGTMHSGGADAFVMHLSTFGWIQYSTLLGGSGLDAGFGIDVDGDGCAYIAGQTDSLDFPTTSGALSQVLNGHGLPLTCLVKGVNVTCPDGMVAKLNPEGSAIAYSTFLSGSCCPDYQEGGQQDQSFDIAVDTAGRAHVATRTNSIRMPVSSNAFQMTNPFGRDSGHVATLDPTGSTLDYGSFLGGSECDGAHAIALDATETKIYIAGFSQSCDFPVVGPPFDSGKGVGSSCNDTIPDAIFAVFNVLNGALEYSSFLGGSRDEFGWDVAVDAAGDVFVTGITKSPDFPTTPGSWDTTYNRQDDAFVTRFSASSGFEFLANSTYFGSQGVDKSFVMSVGPTTGWLHFAGQTSSPLLPLSLTALDSVFDGPTEAFIAALNMP